MKLARDGDVKMVEVRHLEVGEAFEDPAVEGGVAIRVRKPLGVARLHTPGAAVWFLEVTTGKVEYYTASALSRLVRSLGEPVVVVER